jgi:hypothetical protein
VARFGKMARGLFENLATATMRRLKPQPQKLSDERRRSE